LTTTAISLDLLISAVKVCPTLCLIKCANFEKVYIKIIGIDFDDIWQKYSKYSRIEFACFSFHVGLLFYQVFLIGGYTISVCDWSPRPTQPSTPP